MDFQTPDDIINAGKGKFKEYGKFIPLAAAAIFLLIGAAGSVYSVGPEEVGVVQRFGKYVRTTSPGLHIKLPFGIEKITPVPVRRILKQEFGLRTLQAGIRSEYSKRNYADESLMLTGDLNIVDVRWIVQFKVADPEKLLFSVRNPQDIIRDISEVVMRRLVGDYRVDEVLTTKREEIDHLAQVESQKIFDEYNTGVKVVTVKLQDVNPPDSVKPAFNEVNEAKQEKERVINQAWESYNKIIPKAKGQAEQTIRQAEGYSLDKINRAEGEAERFTEVLKEYTKAPKITKKRLYLDTMAEIIPKAKNKYIIDPDQKSILPLLKLSENGEGVS
ncbi:MAG: FtsH protease activity modulator HflK [Candidatus Omnitrophota bacterium]